MLTTTSCSCVRLSRCSKTDLLSACFELGTQLNPPHIPACPPACCMSLCVDTIFSSLSYRNAQERTGTHGLHGLHSLARTQRSLLRNGRQVPAHGFYQVICPPKRIPEHFRQSAGGQIKLPSALNCISDPLHVVEDCSHSLRRSLQDKLDKLDKLDLHPLQGLRQLLDCRGLHIANKKGEADSTAGSGNK